MTKVAIFGNAGGGKSTLSKVLGNAKDLPVYSLDQLLWNPGWVPTPSEIFEEKHTELVGKDEWIIDGLASFSSVQRRVSAADTIIFIDLPLWVHYWWAVKRQLKCVFGARSDFVDGCPMLPKTFVLAKLIWEVHKYLRPEILSLMDKVGEEKRVFHLRSARDIEWFKLTHCVV